MLVRAIMNFPLQIWGVFKMMSKRGPIEETKTCRLFGAICLRPGIFRPRHFRPDFLE